MPYNPKTRTSLDEYKRFVAWVTSTYGDPQKYGISPTNFKKSDVYEYWKSNVDTQAAITTTPTASAQELELTPEEYMGFIRKAWWEDPDFDNSTIPEKAKALQAQVEAEGFSIYSPGYAAALEYKNSFKEQGLEIITNYEGKGYDVAIDQQGNMSIIGGTALDESEMSAWQKAQYDLDLKQLGLSKEKFAFNKQSQEAQMQLSQLQYAAQLAGLGEKGWIERWYAQQAQQAQAPVTPKPPWAQGGGLGGMAGWEDMTPQERGDWIRRFQHSQWANIDPTIQEQVTQGYGFPSAPPGESISYGEPSSAPWGGQKEIDIKPDGTIKIKEGGGAPYGPPHRGPQYTGGVAGSRPHPRGPSGGAAPPFPVGEPGGKVGGGKAAPLPTTPPTPAGLPQFAPWLTAGQPITKGQMPTPSGQLLSRTPPSVLAMLKGFTEWGGAGRSLEDIWAHVGRMQPRAPRGAGYPRWPAARQV